MNLIKFKESFADERVGADWHWYNINLRGKYAYWVRCHYVIPLDAITPNMYVSFETTINNLLGYDYYVLTQNTDDYDYVYEHVDDRDVSCNQKDRAVLVESVPENPESTDPVLIKTCSNHIAYVDLWSGDYNWMNAFIDYTETDNVNSIDKYKLYNNCVPDEGELTADDLKKFRTWLATSLLGVNYTYYELVDDEYIEVHNPSLDVLQEAVEVSEVPEIEDESPLYIKIHNLNITDWTADDEHMLEYYAGGMYDDTLKWMGVFGGVNVTYNSNVATSSCACTGSGNISSLYNSSVSTCDTVSIYRSGIKKEMVNLFSNTDTWSTLPSTYVLLVKQYIDGIIQSNFALGVSDQSNYYTDRKSVV